MNFVIHGLSGVVLSRALPEEHRSAATVAGLAAAACLPDLDCISILWGRAAFLAVHRGYTHSLAGVLLTSLVFALIWRAARGGVGRAAALEPTREYLGRSDRRSIPGGIVARRSNRPPYSPSSRLARRATRRPSLANIFPGRLFAWIAAAQYLHVFLDLLNPYGVWAFKPFSDRRLTLGTDISGNSMLVLLAFMTAALWLYRVEVFGFALERLGLRPVQNAEGKA